MQFAKPPVLTRLLTLCLLALPAAGCVGTPPIATAQSACASLIPDRWRLPVEAAPLPEGDTVGDWIAFGDAQTARLDEANGRTSDAISIVERCEARDIEAVRTARRPWWRRIF